MNRSRRMDSGFTLVELLVVIAIIGILIALLLPAVQAAREAGRRTQCTNHLKQIGLAMHNYHDAHHVLPYANAYDHPNGPAAMGRLSEGGTWCAMVLPYLEQQPLYDRFDFDKMMGDASVHFFPETIDYRLYNYLGTRDGGEVAAVPQQAEGWRMKDECLGSYAPHLQCRAPEPGKSELLRGSRSGIRRSSFIIHHYSGTCP